MSIAIYDELDDVQADPYDDPDALQLDGDQAAWNLEGAPAEVIEMVNAQPPRGVVSPSQPLEVFPIKGGALTCGYGVRGPWAAGYHPGRDYRAHYEPVEATKDAVVQSVGWSRTYGPDYGNLLVLQTGAVRHMYAHLSAIKVHRGEHVKAGQVIATSGNTGRTSGPHLHYEERVAQYGYWDHRRPQYDLEKLQLPVLDVSRLSRAARQSATYAQVSLYKTELADALRDNHRAVATMEPGDFFGDNAAENTRRLQKLWYPHGDWTPGVPGARIIKRLGNRRAKWKTVA